MKGRGVIILGHCLYNSKNYYKEFNVVSAIKFGSTVAIKAFTPVNLGLAGKTFTKQQLYSTLKQNVESNVNDETLKNL